MTTISMSAHANLAPKTSKFATADSDARHYAQLLGRLTDRDQTGWLGHDASERWERSENRQPDPLIDLASVRNRACMRSGGGHRKQRLRIRPAD